MSDLWLTPDEVERLTAKRIGSAQCRALDSLGIPYIRNAVNEPLVARSHFETKERARKKPELRLGKVA